MVSLDKNELLIKNAYFAYAEDPNIGCNTTLIPSNGVIVQRDVGIETSVHSNKFDVVGNVGITSGDLSILIAGMD